MKLLKECNDNFFKVIYYAVAYKSLNLFQGYGQVKLKK